MITATRILGVASEPLMRSRLTELYDRNQVETLTVEKNDTLRRRWRGVTNKGTEIAVALERTEHLSDGAVLCLDADRAVIVRVSEEFWLRVMPRDADAALEAGYFIGNLHWRVRFEPGAILIALEAPTEQYIERLAHLTMVGKVRLSSHG